MKALKTLLASVSLLSLSACATIIEGSSDTINISTNPPTNASCTLSNKRGNYNVSTPSATTVQKSRSDLNVSCADSRTGAQGNSTIVSDVEPWAFGNILLGGIIGLGIDWSTGAAYNYPPTAVVPMVTPVAYAPAAQPVDGSTAPLVAQPALAPAAVAPSYAPAPAPTLVPAPATNAPQETPAQR